MSNHNEDDNNGAEAGGYAAAGAGVGAGVAKSKCPIAQRNGDALISKNRTTFAYSRLYPRIIVLIKVVRFFSIFSTGGRRGRDAAKEMFSNFNLLD